jgi:hypothetical protein
MEQYGITEKALLANRVDVINGSFTWNRQWVFTSMLNNLTLLKNSPPPTATSLSSREMIIAML